LKTHIVGVLRKSSVAANRSIKIPMGMNHQIWICLLLVLAFIAV
jgi:hypothetical protein